MRGGKRTTQVLIKILFHGVIEGKHRMLKLVSVMKWSCASEATAPYSLPGPLADPEGGRLN